MLPSRHTVGSRYLRTARATYAARFLAAGALVLLPTACGNNDAETFSSSIKVATTTVGTDAPADTTAATATPATTAPEPESTTAATDAADTTTSTDGATFPAGGELVVDFTYSAESGGRVHNPYIAVWVEDADGNLVQTISLWYEQSGKGTKYLHELHSWFAASGGTDSTTSGATRSAGTYSVAWDGTDLDGNVVPAGNYTLFVEAAREHGPYEITSSPITVSDRGFTVALADNGELSNVTATLTA